VSDRVDADRADDVRLEENLFPFFDLGLDFISETGGFRQRPEGKIQAPRLPVMDGILASGRGPRKHCAGARKPPGGCPRKTR